MSIPNPFYDQMKPNPICLKIPWRDWTPETQVQFTKWKEGKTGFPFIDAAMRQLLQEGWLHHVTRFELFMHPDRGLYFTNPNTRFILLPY
jgi:cryptochrome